MTRTRVLLVADWFVRITVPLAVAHVHAGLAVAVLVRDHAREFGGDNGERAELLATAAAAGVDLFTIPDRLGDARQLRSLARTRRHISAWSPEVVHVQDNSDARLWALAAGQPTVMTVHDAVPHPGHRALPPHRQLMRRAWLRRADAFLVHGASVAAELSHQRACARVRVVPVGVAVRDKPLPAPETPTVLLFGRLEPYKGIATLVRAMTDVWLERPEVRLLVIGEGPSASLLPEDDRIEVREGYLPEAAIDAAFSEATIAVLPYTQASQSYVGNLAVARGLPTVVSDVGALSELVPDPTFLVRAGDQSSLARGILRYLDHSAELRQRVLEHARAELSWERAASETAEVYRILSD